MMTTLQRYLIYLGIAVVLLGGSFTAGVLWCGHRAASKALAVQSQADQHEGAALSDAAKAADLKKQADAQAAVVTQTDASVASAKQKLARLQKFAQPEVGPDRPAALSEGVEPPQAVAIERDHYKALYEQALEVIAEDDKAVAAAKLQASIERARGDQLQAALDESQKALALQKVADDATIRSERAKGFRSQLVHVGEAAVVAYFAGKYAH